MTITAEQIQEIISFYNTNWDIFKFNSSVFPVFQGFLSLDEEYRVVMRRVQRRITELTVGEEREPFIQAMNHLQSTNGGSLAVYLRMNPDLANFLWENLELMKVVFNEFRRYSQKPDTYEHPKLNPLLTSKFKKQTDPNLYADYFVDDLLEAQSGASSSTGLMFSWDPSELAQQAATTVVSWMYSKATEVFHDYLDYASMIEDADLDPMEAFVEAQARCIPDLSPLKRY